LDQADPRQFIDALMKASSSAASKLAIAAHTAEPETLAKRMVDRNEKDGRAVLMALVLGIIATTTETDVLGRCRFSLLLLP
jgi:hypothetical protein